MCDFTDSTLTDTCSWTPIPAPPESLGMVAPCLITKTPLLSPLSPYHTQSPRSSLVPGKTWVCFKAHRHIFLWPCRTSFSFRFLEIVLTPLSHPKSLLDDKVITMTEIRKSELTNKKLARSHTVVTSLHLAWLCLTPNRCEYGCLQVPQLLYRASPQRWALYTPVCLREPRSSI